MESTTAATTTIEAPAPVTSDTGPTTLPAETPATGESAPSDEGDERSVWETIALKADHLEDTIERILHESTVRRIVVKQGDDVVAEFPVAVGVVGAVLAAPVVAIAAIVALLGDCTIDVERVEEPAPAAAPEPVQPSEGAQPGQHTTAPAT